MRIQITFEQYKVRGYQFTFWCLRTLIPTGAAYRQNVLLPPEISNSSNSSAEEHSEKCSKFASETRSAYMP